MLRNGILIPPFRSFFIPTESSPPYKSCASTASFNVSSATSALMLDRGSFLMADLCAPRLPVPPTPSLRVPRSVHTSFLQFSLSLSSLFPPYLYYFFDSHFFCISFETVSFPFAVCPIDRVSSAPILTAPAFSAFSPPLLAVFSALFRIG